MEDMKVRLGTSIVLAACAAVAEPSLPKGPEAWLEFVDGNVRKDGLRLDLEALKDAGISGVHFFHIGRGEHAGSEWPGCEELSATKVAAGSSGAKGEVTVSNTSDRPLAHARRKPPRVVRGDVRRQGARSWTSRRAARHEVPRGWRLARVGVRPVRQAERRQPRSVSEMESSFR